MTESCTMDSCPFSGQIIESSAKIKMLVPLVERIDENVRALMINQAREQGREEIIKDDLDDYRAVMKGRAKTIREALIDAEERQLSNQNTPTGNPKGFVAGILAVGILLGSGVVSVAKWMGFLKLFGG